MAWDDTKTDLVDILYATDWNNLVAAVKAGGSSATHNGLDEIQGGTTNEYYHLDSTSYASVVRWDVAGSPSYVAVSGFASNAALLGGASSDTFAAAGHNHNHNDLDNIDGSTYHLDATAYGSVNGWDVAPLVHSHTYVDVSGYATISGYATECGSATTSVTSDYAEYSSYSDAATTSVTSDYAEYSSYSDAATTAEYASICAYATECGTASNSELLDSHDSSYFAIANPLSTDTLWAAKGDLVLGTGDNAAAILTAGADGTVPVYASGETTGMIPVAAKRSIFLSLAGGWTGTTLPDGGFVTTETTTHKVNLRGTLFSATTTDMNHEFGCILPDNFSSSAPTITGRPVFTTSATDAENHTIIFGLQAIAYADGDAADAAYGTAKTSTKTVASSIAGKIIIGATTDAITIAGSPDGGQWCQFRCYRDGDDTFAGDVTLLGWIIVYTTDNYSDA